MWLRAEQVTVERHLVDRPGRQGGLHRFARGGGRSSKTRPAMPGTACAVGARTAKLWVGRLCPLDQVRERGEERHMGLLDQIIGWHI